MDSLPLHFCQWLAASWVGTAIRESDNLFSVIETAHVLGIVVTAGLIAIVDLRLLGILLSGSPASDLIRPLVKLTWCGFTWMLASGFLLFWSEADRLYANPVFRAKLFLLAILGLNQLVFHRTAYRRIAEWDLNPIAPRTARLTAGLSLVGWLAVIALGRAIAYL
jgi:hypothetical protein